MRKKNIKNYFILYAFCEHSHNIYSFTILQKLSKNSTINSLETLHILFFRMNHRKNNYQMISKLISQSPRS